MQFLDRHQRRIVQQWLSAAGGDLRRVEDALRRTEEDAGGPVRADDVLRCLKEGDRHRPDAGTPSPAPARRRA